MMGTDTASAVNPVSLGVFAGGATKAGTWWDAAPAPVQLSPEATHLRWHYAEQQHARSKIVISVRAPRPPDAGQLADA